MYELQILKEDALADDFCQGIMHYICDKVYNLFQVPFVYCKVLALNNFSILR